MKSKHKWIVLFILLFPAFLHAGNPFLSRPDSRQKEMITKESGRFSGEQSGDSVATKQDGKSIFFANTLLEKIKIVQKRIHGTLTTYARKIQSESSPSAVLSLFLFSFLYGIFHAAGPGHGKAVVFSYFLSRDARFRNALSLGSMIGFFHAASAIILVIILRWILLSYVSGMEKAEFYIQIFSYAAILGIGIFMAVEWIRETFFPPSASGLGEGAGHHRKERTSLAIALAVGAVPCPGVVLIMIFGFSLEIFWTSLVASVFMAFGMAFTISFAGIITLYMRKGLLAFAGKSPTKFRILHASLSGVGVLFILIFASILFLGSL